MFIIKTIFLISIAFIFYTYFGYPLLLAFLLPFKRKRVNKRPFTPYVSFIITVYNEEERIRRKIENTLSLNYPEDKLEIIVASDCSTDRTDEIALSFSDKGVKLVRSPVRKGKEYAQKIAIEKAKGKIIVFSDASSYLLRDSLKNIIENFADLSVGCVSSIDKIINPDGKDGGESLYVKYEMFLRRIESKINSLVGVSGSFFAVRKELCSNWPYELASDFNVVLNSIRAGKRAVLDEEAVALYQHTLDERKEFNRKVRIILRGITVLFKNLDMLNLFKYGFFSWQLLSHKLFRWCVPFFLIICFFSNILLLKEKLFLILFITQCVVYTIPVFFLFSKKDTFLRKLTRYFLVINLSTIVAWYKFIKGERITTWTPSERNTMKRIF